MAMIKKNIWTLFFIIIFIGIVISSIISYYQWQNIKNSYILKQENLTYLMSNSILHRFNQYEMVLELLGNELYDNSIYKDHEKSLQVMNRVLNSDPTIQAFALSKPDGSLYLTSSNLSVAIHKNLLDIEETKKSFQDVLKSKNMVPGRTYFNKALQKLIIPLRKAIRDKDGKVVAVISSVINVEDASYFFGKYTSDALHTMLLLRDNDRYYQLIPNDKKDPNIYKKQMPEEFKKYLLNVFADTLNLNYSQLKQSEKPLSIIHKAFYDKDKTVIATTKYIDKYRYWLSTQTNFSKVKSEFFSFLGYLSITVFLLYFILYLLFRKIHTYETDKKNALIYQAEHDYLTGLNNRLYLSKIFNNHYEKSPYSLLFIDMDNFKKINDQYGHNYGDIVLNEISLRLKTLKEKDDILVRYSGDEFIFVKYETDKTKISAFSNKILDKLSKPFIVEHYQFFLSSSIGIAQYPIDSNIFDEIKSHADIAMYEAKKEKNTYMFFEDSLKAIYIENAQIEEALNSAIPNNEIYMMYQPQVNKNGELYGVEALVRWESSKLGFIPPDKFIKVAENSGKMNQLGDFIIQTTLKEIKQIQKNTSKNFQTSINISIRQFMDINFYEKLLEYIKRNDFKFFNITLEITENIFIEDMDFIIDLLLKIKQNNILVSLDDFGTGYSSLSLLKKLPIDELKIDKSFVDDILVDTNAKNMIKSIITIGKQLNMKILAEGIETLEQKELLDRYDCDLYQGYYFSKPLKKDDLERYIKG